MEGAKNTTLTLLGRFRERLLCLTGSSKGGKYGSMQYYTKCRCTMHTYIHTNIITKACFFWIKFLILRSEQDFTKLISFLHVEQIWHSIFIYIYFIMGSIYLLIFPLFLERVREREREKRMKGQNRKRKNWRDLRVEFAVRRFPRGASEVPFWDTRTNLL